MGLITVYGTAGLAHQMFRMPFHNVIRNRADAFETHSFVKALCGPIERGDTKKHIWMFAENSLFDLFDQQRANAIVAPFGHDAEQMDVSTKRSTHIQQNETDDLLALSRDINFARRIHQWLDAMLVSAAQGNPGLRGVESAGANLSLVFAPHAAEANLNRAWHWKIAG